MTANTSIPLTTSRPISPTDIPQSREENAIPHLGSAIHGYQTRSNPTLTNPPQHVMLGLTYPPDTTPRAVQRTNLSTCCLDAPPAVLRHLLEDTMVVGRAPAVCLLDGTMRASRWGMESAGESIYIHM